MRADFGVWYQRGMVMTKVNPFACSQLIYVAQPSNTEEVSKIYSEYPRLFNQRFRLPLSSSSSSSPEATHVMEESWLAADADKFEDWAQIKKMDMGALVIGFENGVTGDAQGSDRRPAGSEQHLPRLG